MGWGAVLGGLASAFLPVITRRLGEKGRARRRRLRARQYGKEKRRDIRKTTKTNMKLFQKYYPKMQKYARAERDEALGKLRQSYDSVYHSSPQHKDVKKMR